MASLEILLEIGKLSFDYTTKLALAERKNGWYVEYITKIKEDAILPGAREFIENAKSAGYKIALGSASKNARIILDGLKLTNCFDAIIDGNKVSKAKPDPEVFLLAAQELGVLTECCVIFEDAKAGIEAAKRAGMKCIGVGTSPELSGADFIIQGFLDTGLELLEKLNVR
jgi:beta-phosphoglucomutase